MRRGLFIAGVLALASALGPACEAPPDTATPGATDTGGDSPLVHALLELPRGGAPPPDGFYALPFPNDLRVEPDGSIDLRDHPRPNQLIALYLDTIQTVQRGFGLSSAGFFRFDGPVAPRSLPQTAEDSLRAGSSVYLVDVDPDSPDFGQHVPILTEFGEDGGQGIGPDWLSLRPYPGFTLRERTTYAMVATRRLHDPYGHSIRPAADYLAVADPSPTSDPDVARARAIYQPLLSWLDQPGGDRRDDVVAAAVFTTQDATSLLGRIRQVIWRDLPMPRPRRVVFRREEYGYRWYDGLYDGPIFQAGAIPYLRPEDGGDIEVDPDTGEPVLQRLDPLRFSFSVPTGEMPASGWPVAIYAHGTGGDYHSFRDSGTAAWLASAGIACVSIDQVMHGTRQNTATPDVAFFNFQNPLAARSNPLQGALDDFQVVRLILNFDYTERRTGGQTVRFDPDRIYFFGHSQGSVTGVPFVATEPLVKAAVLSGAGGVLYLTMLYKTQPTDIAGLVKLLLRDDPLDEYNPFLALVQMFMDRADSVSYGRLLVEEPPPGREPLNVFQTEGLVDHYVPLPCIEALATAIGEDPVAPILQPVDGLALEGHSGLATPVSDNQNGATSVLMQYQAAPDSDGHFVIFDIQAARQQSTNFLSTMAHTGQAVVTSP